MSLASSSYEPFSLPRDSSSSPADSRSAIWLDRFVSKVNDRLLWAIIIALLCLTMGPRLFRSLWVDEAGTFWMAQGGPLDAIHKTWQWPGQSVLYAAIESFFVLKSGPLREFVLRLPSIAGACISYFFVYRLAESALGKAAGLIALILFAFHPLTLQFESQARPYSLALASVMASCWSLYRWVETRRTSFLLFYVIASALVIYLHYFFAIIFLAHAIYLLYVFAVDRLVARWTHVLLSYGAIAVLIMPLWPHMRLLLREAHTLPFVPAPTLLELVDFLTPSFFIFGVLAAALIVQFVFPKFLKQPISLQRSFFVLLFCWWVVGPAIFFLASVATPMRVFLPRYLAFAIPAQALIIAYAGYSILGAIGGRIWALLAVLLSTASPLGILASRSVGFEELMPFMRIIQSESRNGAPPVFYSSPLPESNFYDWQRGLSDPNTSRLFAPFVVYPMKDELLPLPYRLTDPVKAHIQNVIAKKLTETNEVIFVAHQGTGWDSWMIAEMRGAGFHAETIQPNAYSVTIFKR